MTSAYVRAKEFSEERLSRLRTSIAGIVPLDAAVITSGSYARREASQSSDIDYFSVLPGECPQSQVTPSWIGQLNDAVASVVLKSPADGGAFKDFEYAGDMVHNIGGDRDSNAKITRRILLLLEGEWLTQKDAFERLRREILERYIQESITDHQLALFLLNDIIRYYRTIAVDFEFKTFEASKPWAIRNIKLMFSRKLLYASGLFSVAMTADRAYPQKIQLLEKLFALPVIDRMTEICGESAMNRVLNCYNYFLEKMEDPGFRDHLNSLPRGAEGRADVQFRALKNEGHHFTRYILTLFENTFGSGHPIRKAVVF